MRSTYENNKKYNFSNNLWGTNWICIIYSTKLQKDSNENVTNLVINYTNVTGKMNGKVIIDDDETIYLSLDDIENYYDRYIFFEKQYNYIIATANGKTACFDIKNQTLTINDKKENAKL